MGCARSDNLGRRNGRQPGDAGITCSDTDNGRSAFSPLASDVDHAPVVKVSHLLAFANGHIQ